MFVEKLHLTQKKSRQILCLLLAFFMFFLQGSASTQGLNFLSEKTTETEKEENRTEKDSEDDQEGEQSSIGKSKKAKKLTLPHFSYVFYHPTQKVYFSPDYVTIDGWVNYKNLWFNPYTPLLFATPRYVAFHTLIFYES